MAGTTSVVGDSQEAVALRLLEFIAAAEQKPLGVQGGVSKTWILETYKECLHAIKKSKPPKDAASDALAAGKVVEFGPE